MHLYSTSAEGSVQNSCTFDSSRPVKPSARQEPARVLRAGYPVRIPRRRGRDGSGIMPVFPESYPYTSGFPISGPPCAQAGPMPASGPHVRPGKPPTTPVRRRISRFKRSSGLPLWVCRRRTGGNAWYGKTSPLPASTMGSALSNRSVLGLFTIPAALWRAAPLPSRGGWLKHQRCVSGLPRGAASARYGKNTPRGGGAKFVRRFRQAKAFVRYRQTNPLKATLPQVP